MKKILAASAILVVILPLFACNKNSEQTPPKKLSDNYATTALLALKTIERDIYQQKLGSNLVSKDTQGKIDAADALAQAGEEKKITDALNFIYKAKVRFNWQVHQKDLLLEIVHLELRLHNTPKTDLKKDNNRAKEWSEAISVADTKLETCFADFDTSLRSRATNVPASCVFNSSFPFTEKELAEYGR